VQSRETTGPRASSGLLTPWQEPCLGWSFRSWTISSLLGKDEPRPDREDHELSTVAGAQLAMARLLWPRDGGGTENNSLAISWLDRPVTTQASISRSRSVSASRPDAEGVPSTRCRLNWLTTRWVTDGDSRASPAATTRTARSSSAGSASLRMKPLAPTCRLHWLGDRCLSGVSRRLHTLRPRSGLPVTAPRRACCPVDRCVARRSRYRSVGPLPRRRSARRSAPTPRPGYTPHAWSVS
jgi:hypothetical protein